MIPERRITARHKTLQAVQAMACELPDDDNPIVQTFNKAYTEYVTGAKPITCLRKAFDTLRREVFKTERSRWQEELQK